MDLWRRVRVRCWLGDSDDMTRLEYKGHPPTTPALLLLALGNPPSSILRPPVSEERSGVDPAAAPKLYHHHYAYCHAYDSATPLRSSLFAPCLL
jgi:hypothetical protein